jgi:hypothetical protein
MSDSSILPVLAGLSVGIAFIVIFMLANPGNNIVSDLELQENLEQTEEVRALMSRYPEASVGFHRDEKLRSVSFFGYSEVFPNGEGKPGRILYSMVLTSLADLVTEVQEMELACTIADGVHDNIQTVFYVNIEQEIITGDCLDVPIPDSWYVQPEPYSYRTSVGNKTFDVQYMFSSGVGTVGSINVNSSTLVVSLAVETDQATLFSIKLEEALLEQLQIESDLHYCVGNEFVVLVAEMPVDARFEKDGRDEIIIVEVPTGYSTLEIIGEDLLYSPRMCP